MVHEPNGWQEAGASGWLGFADVPGPIHPADGMLFDRSAERRRQYVEVGRSALACVEAALESAARSVTSVERFLDFGCGYGRVLRAMIQHIPAHRITVSDVEREAVEFCRRAFGVAGAVSTTDLACVDVGRFDLIWIGSVLTHLPLAPGDELLRFCERSLVPGGIAVVSFHGEQALRFLETHYGPECQRDAAAIRRETSADGFAYRNYASHTAQSAYGVAFHTPDFLRRRVPQASPSLEPFHHRPASWNAHHDVMALRKT